MTLSCDGFFYCYCCLHVRCLDVLVNVVGFYRWVFFFKIYSKGRTGIRVQNLRKIDSVRFLFYVGNRKTAHCTRIAIKLFILNAIITESERDQFSPVFFLLFFNCGEKSFKCKITRLRPRHALKNVPSFQ